MKKAIYKKIHLDFADDDFILIVANTSKEGFDFLKEKHKKFAEYDLGDKDFGACTVYHSSEGCAILFNYDSIKAYIICHEVGHATWAIFKQLNIFLDDSTDEVYAYHNSMLFKYVIDFLKENKIKIKI